MSCTIYYKGRLKEGKTTDDLLRIIARHIKSLGAEIITSPATVAVNFTGGKSEPLRFELKNRRFEGSCKWNGEKPEEFYGILDMFTDLKSVAALKIEDDDGLWEEYGSRTRPCKISLRPLSLEEKALLGRIEQNEQKPPAALERLIPSCLDLDPYSKPLLRIIVQDFIKIMRWDGDRIGDFQPRLIVDTANELQYWGKAYQKREIARFKSDFAYMLLEIWLSNAFSYKTYGVVKSVPEATRGIATSREAAEYGILSVFLNRHTGGASNAKEAEIRRFVRAHYGTGALGEARVIDGPEKTLEFFFSITDFLGFHYLGAR